MNHLSLPFDLKKIEMIGQQYPNARFPGTGGFVNTSR